MIGVTFARICRSILVSLGFNYPIRLAVGTACGCMLHFFISSLHADFPSISIFKKIDENQIIFVVSVAVIIAFGSIVRSPLSGSDKMTIWLNSVEDSMLKAGMSSSQQHKIWKTITARLVAAFNMQDDLLSYSSTKILEGIDLDEIDSPPENETN